MNSDSLISNFVMNSDELNSVNSPPCVQMDMEQIPKIVNWEEYVPQGSDQRESQMAVSRLFDERPIWSKNVLIGFENAKSSSCQLVLIGFVMLKPRWEDIWTFRAFPYKLQTSLQVGQNGVVQGPLPNTGTSEALSLKLSHSLTSLTVSHSSSLVSGLSLLSRSRTHCLGESDSSSSCVLVPRLVVVIVFGRQLVSFLHRQLVPGQASFLRPYSFFSNFIDNFRNVFITNRIIDNAMEDIDANQNEENVVPTLRSSLGFDLLIVKKSCKKHFYKHFACKSEESTLTVAAFSHRRTAVLSPLLYANVELLSCCCYLFFSVLYVGLRAL
ncbi:hypothetical protein Ahy_A02g009782 [Arachis hypogaea]|uniref:Uncharacterized protein n=1 Tax=Arachis hypogaea TaxID=3818 RepID=A0A445EI36_ARAHY|nr:hypothetical protein Ahy_A02g009782 [Arachis hypogaea]